MLGYDYFKDCGPVIREIKERHQRTGISIFAFEKSGLQKYYLPGVSLESMPVELVCRVQGIVAVIYGVTRGEAERLYKGIGHIEMEYRLNLAEYLDDKLDEMNLSYSREDWLGF